MNKSWYEREGWTIEDELAQRGWEDTDDTRLELTREILKVLEDRGEVANDNGRYYQKH